MWQCHVSMEVASTQTCNKKIMAVVTEVNLVSNCRDWWVDTGATLHIYSDRSGFVSYELVGDGQEPYMGNSYPTKLIGQGKVILHLSSNKSNSDRSASYARSAKDRLLFSFEHGLKSQTRDPPDSSESHKTRPSRVESQKMLKNREKKKREKPHLFFKSLPTHRFWK